MTASASYLRRFFAEKALEDQTYEITAPDGMLHLIPTGCVIEAIMAAPAREQDGIASILRRIDFANGDVHHFLRHLAQPLADRLAGVF
jgi:hypothetical protein